MTKYYFILLILVSCINAGKKTVSQKANNKVYKYLALGDSYTIGESVCSSCNYPQQLTDSLNTSLPKKTEVKIIAKTGWTTTDLLAALAQDNPTNDYDLVTLLIGVNNQYQDKPFTLYEKEFTELLDTAIFYAKGNRDHVIVISIPDYAFTPFGQKSGKAEKITSELENYNAFAEKISKAKGVNFENITLITQSGLANPDLVASKDGLHPSAVAYKRFVELVFPKVRKILN